MGFLRLSLSVTTSSVCFSSFSFCFTLVLFMRKGTNRLHRPPVCSFFFPLSMSISLSPRMTRFSPMAWKKSSRFAMSWNVASWSAADAVYSMSLLLKNVRSSSSPRFCISRPSRRSMACIFAFALAVDTKLIHEGCTCCDFEVSISIWSPLCSLWLSGTSLWFTFAPMQWLPRKVWMEKAKSSAVHPAGMVFISPLGVNTKISDAKRLSFMASRKSMASGCGSSSISLMVCSHSLSSPSSSVNSISPPSLYFQCAANPCSAISSILSERICTSIHRPCFDISVTCSAWYPFAFGWLSQSRSRSGCALYI